MKIFAFGHFNPIAPRRGTSITLHSKTALFKFLSGPRSLAQTMFGSVDFLKLSQGSVGNIRSAFYNTY